MNKRSKDNEGQKPGTAPAFAGANVRKFRESKSYSLGQLALAAGLSRDDLELLEKGRLEPTIKTLWSLANALGVQFSALLASSAPESTASPSRPAESPRRKVPLKGSGGPEVHELHLRPRQIDSAAALHTGSFEHILVTKGAAIIEGPGVHLVLKAGESRVIAADIERQYRNESDADAALYIVVTHAPQS